MVDDVKAALTARRWAEWLGPSAWETTKGNGFGLYNGEMLIWHDDIAPSPIRGTTRHALAALALYQQPFGFTRDDLTLVRWMLSFAGLHDLRRVTVEWEGHRDDMARARSIAARIAALLPPEPTDG